MISSDMPLLHAPADGRCSELRAFLKQRRSGIQPTVRVLGSHQRHSSRCGRRVTQEELAEAIGVSRTWYALLECGAAIRPSARLLDRLASSLMLSPHERNRLFCLAVPEFRAAQISFVE
jgi:DNA-binding XRE family transcriptional regulator